MLNEKGMVPKDKGWEMSNLGLWGKNPCVTTLCVLPPFLVSPNRFDFLMEVVGEVIILGVGWQDYQSFSHTPSPPMTFHSLHSIPVSSPSRRRLLRFAQSRGLFFSLMCLAFTSTAILSMVVCPHAYSSTFTMVVCWFFLRMVGLLLRLTC